MICELHPLKEGIILDELPIKQKENFNDCVSYYEVVGCILIVFMLVPAAQLNSPPILFCFTPQSLLLQSTEKPPSWCFA